MIRRHLAADRPPAGLLLLLVLVVGLLSLLPLGSLALAGLTALARPAALDVLADPTLWRAVVSTLVTASGGTLIAVALGALFAYPLALADPPGRRLFGFLFILPMMIPPQVTALAWVQMSGPSSPLLKMLHLAPPLGTPQPLYSWGGMALLLGVQQGPLVYLALRASLVSLPRDLIEAARLAGAGPGRVWRDIILPLSLPGLIAGAAIAFVSSIGNFGIAAILGLPAGIYTLATLIYGKFAAFTDHTFGDVALLSGLIAVIAVAGLMVQERALRGRDYRLIGLSGATAAFTLGRWRPLVAAVLALVLMITLLGPCLALVTSALVPALGVRLTFETLSFHAFGDILFRQSVTRSALVNSLLLATGTAALLTALSLLTAALLGRRRDGIARLILALIDIPYALPGIVVAVAAILLLAAPLPLLHVTLYGTLWIILFAYCAHFFAPALKPLLNACRQLDPALDEAARLAGAGFTRRLGDILLPLVAPAAGASAVLVFLTACNELTLSSLLWSPGHQTLGVALYNLDDSGSADLASALAVLVVGLVVLLMLGLELLAPRLPKGTLPWRL